MTEKDDKATGKLRPKPLKANARYEVKAGFNFGCTPDNDEGTRVEPGELTVKLPPAVLDQLVDMGAIVEVTEDAS